MPTPTLPVDCRVETLAEWVHKMWAFDERIMPEDVEMARAVRALVESVALDAATRARYTTPAEAVRQAMSGVAP